MVSAFVFAIPEGLAPHEMYNAYLRPDAWACIRRALELTRLLADGVADMDAAKEVVYGDE